MFIFSWQCCFSLTFFSPLALEEGLISVKKWERNCWQQWKGCEEVWFWGSSLTVEMVLCSDRTGEVEVLELEAEDSAGAGLLLEAHGAALLDCLWCIGGAAVKIGWGCWCWGGAVGLRCCWNWDHRAGWAERKKLLMQSLEQWKMKLMESHGDGEWKVAGGMDVTVQSLNRGMDEWRLGEKSELFLSLSSHGISVLFLGGWRNFFFYKKNKFIVFLLITYPCAIKKLWSLIFFMVQIFFILIFCILIFF